MTLPRFSLLHKTGGSVFNPLFPEEILQFIIL